MAAHLDHLNSKGPQPVSERQVPLGRTREAPKESDEEARIPEEGGDEEAAEIGRVEGPGVLLAHVAAGRGEQDRCVALPVASRPPHTLRQIQRTLLYVGVQYCFFGVHELDAPAVGKGPFREGFVVADLDTRPEEELHD